MRKLLLIAFLLCASSLCFGTTRNAATCNYADVNTQVVASANGDTVVIPAGTCTWASALSWSGKGITLQGAGALIGDANKGKGTNCPGCTVIIDNAPTGSHTSLININGCSATNFDRITGIQFVSSALHSDGMILVDGTRFDVCMRFDHSTMYMTTANTRGISPTNIYMLMDHILFDSSNSTSATQMISPTGCSDGTDGGFTCWQQPLSLGTINAVFVEDSVIEFPTTCGFNDTAFDSYGGARWVLRHNDIYNTEFGGGHGTDSGNRRSYFSGEVYNNRYFNNSGCNRRMGTSRGGLTVVHDNTLSATAPATWGSFTLMNYRYLFSDGSDISGWGQCNGTNWALGSTSFSADGSRQNHVDTGSPSSTNVRWCAPTHLDTVCSSNANCTGGDTCSGFFDGAGSPTSGLCRDQPGKSHDQVTTGDYSWNNTGGGDFGVYDGGTGLPIQNVIVAGRDYKNSTVMPGYTPFTYPHPLQGSVSQVATVTFSPIAGSYPTAQSVSLSTTTAGATICYTTDGSTPTANGSGTCTHGTTYTGAITVSTSQTVQAIGSKSGFTDSGVSSAVYAIGVTNFYVDNSGSPACSDTAGQPGTELAPWCTIGYGVSRLVAGTTLLVKNGNYDNGSTITNCVGTLNAPFVISAYPGHSPVISNQTSGNAGGRMRFQGCSYLTFSGFRITNIQQCIFVDSSDHVVIQNNQCDHSGLEGIHVHFNSSFVTVQGNTVFLTGQNGTNGECGYTGSGSSDPAADNTHDVTWTLNTFSQCAGEGLEVKPGTHNITVSFNNISSWNSVLLTSGGAGIEIDESTGGGQTWPSNPQHIVNGNMVHDGGTATSSVTACSGIRVGSGATVTNNVVFNIDPCGQGIYTNSADGNTYPKLVYNNTVDVPSTRAIINSGGSPSIQNNIGPPTAGNNIAVNSLFFQSYSTHNYQLVNGSAPVGAGTNLLATVPTDITGLVRTTPMDVGAYAYTGTQTPAPTPVMFTFRGAPSISGRVTGK